MTDCNDTLDAAVALCAQLDERDEIMDQRRQLWRQAQDEGCSARQIAEACGVSTELVRLEIAKARKRPWATALMPKDQPRPA